MSNEFADFLNDAIEQSKQFETCMALNICEEGSAVELILDTGIATYSEWIEGEGGDIGLLRCQDTKKVVGCRLPLMKKNLSVFHKGPIRINAGFRKSDQIK